MRRIVFADDDILTINKLYTLLDWNKLGYVVVGQIMDGGEILEKLRELLPDVLLLDVDMPKKSGVEIMSAIAQDQTLKHIQVLMLSNYDNFEYVRSALYAGAVDYLLKHQLNKSLLEQKLKETEKIQRDYQEDSFKSIYLNQIANRTLLHSLVTATPFSPSEQEMLCSQKVFSSASYVLAIMQITNFIIWAHFQGDKARKSLIESILSLSENIFTTLENGLIAPLQNGQFVLLFTFDTLTSHRSILHKTTSYMALLSQNIHKLLNIDSFYSCSSVYYDVWESAQAYERVSHAIDNIPWAKEPSQLQKEVSNITQEKRLLDYLIQHNEPLVLAQIKSLLLEFFQHNPSSNSMQHYLIRFVTMGADFLQEQGIPSPSYPQLLGEEWTSHPLDFTKMEALLTTYYQEVLALLTHRSVQEYSPHIQTALRYIHLHYQQDISLGTLADAVSVSPAHLSRLFSKELTQSFSEYLTTYRIEIAKTLLEQHLPIKSVYKAAGFRSYNYFLRVLKEKTGKTASQIQRHR